MEKNDTITALATPPGEGGIGIIRISGGESFSIAREIFRPFGDKKLPESPKNKYLYYGHIVNEDGELVDEVLLCFMKKPHTYTREDVVEINAHGGSIPIRKIINLCLHKGARLAEPGEFTKRAFLNGRIDLVQAEGVFNIVKARSEKGLKAALSQAKGSLSHQVEALRQKIVNIIVEIEAAADYPEEDTENSSEDRVLLIRNIREKIDNLIETANMGRIYNEGLKTAIIGRPNTGKSSLLNHLIGQEKAIVTEIPGTTRDTLEEIVSIKGIPLKIIDTAGLRKKGGKIEQMGMEKTREAIIDADLVLLMFDVARSFTSEDKWIYDIVKNEEKKRVIVIANKIDLAKEDNFEMDLLKNDKIVSISLKTGEGLEKLFEEVKDAVYQDGLPPGEDAIVTGLRQEEALKVTKEALADGEKSLNEGLPADVAVIDFYRAREKLGEITGQNVDEEILDGIFSQFCLGK